MDELAGLAGAAGADDDAVHGAGSDAQLLLVGGDRVQGRSDDDSAEVEEHAVLGRERARGAIASDEAAFDVTVALDVTLDGVGERRQPQLTDRAQAAGAEPGVAALDQGRHELVAQPGSGHFVRRARFGKEFT